jgi:solute carrier family 12 (sodium/potassium/chloride transporter), member 2
MPRSLNQTVKKFGTLAVFLTAISTILGAVMFLRFGWAVGNVSFYGVLAIIVIGHMVTIPTAMALAEIATNQKVEGGGEYYIISRSFGLNIGAAIGFSLYLSQAISVAFYIVAFAEAFSVLKPWLSEMLNVSPDLINNRYFSISGLLMLTLLILTKGADIGMKALYVVVGILIVSILFFFAGSTSYSSGFGLSMLTDRIDQPVDFFTVFAICFPAFTGMTAGVGLSGDLKDPSKSIPLGTLSATIVGMLVYVAIAYKLASSASPYNLNEDQLIMSSIAIWGPIIPIGLAAATISSALGSFLVAPRTLQAMARDKVFPAPTRLTELVSKGKGKQNEPFNASILTALLALVFVAIGDVNFVAELISMFFMVTYGSLCLISFFQHFSGDPAYRPTFRSKWYISLFGGILCFYLMFQMNSLYAFLAILFMVVNYFAITITSNKKEGIAVMFQGVITQFTRRMLVFLQKAEKAQSTESWRPAIICLSQNSFQSLALFNTLKWISHKYGFGTYIHLIDGYFNSDTQLLAEKDLKRLIKMSNVSKSNFYIDTLISPSYTSAIAQLVQLPGISGQDNNMILFEYTDEQTENLKRIIENVGLIRAAKFDLCLLRTSEKGFGFQRDVHVWITARDLQNANLTIVLGYIIIGHNDWHQGQIKVFAAFNETEFDEQQEKLDQLIVSGRLPVSPSNLKLFKMEADQRKRDLVKQTSAEADLIIMGFNESFLRKGEVGYFQGYEGLCNILFVGVPNERNAKIN